MGSPQNFTERFQKLWLLSFSMYSLKALLKAPFLFRYHRVLFLSSQNQKKDASSLENGRLICLLNTDYKILASILANRIKKSLPHIISETQSGFLSKRHIANNVRLVLDILRYQEFISHNSFILFLDFYKAFDTLEHSYIYQSLNKFGFGNYFTCAV